MVDLAEIVATCARSLSAVDARRPQAVSSRTGAVYQPGVGPFAEAAAVAMVAADMATDASFTAHALNVPYGPGARQRCDWCLGAPGRWSWAIEVKLLRLMGDNNKPNDNMLMHLLSPYPEHRSALTDCTKLADSDLGSRRAVLIYAFDYLKWPMEPAIDAFEVLAARTVRLGERVSAKFEGLVHPVHERGAVFAWEVCGRR